MKTFNHRCLLVVIVTALMISACSSASTPEPQSTAAAKSTPEPAVGGCAYESAPVQVGEITEIVTHPDGQVEVRTYPIIEGDPTQSEVCIEPETADTMDVTDVPALPEPTFIGSPDLDAVCERGPTSVSAEADVSRAAPPGSMLNYTAVAYLQYAAKLNRWATEDCALETGEPPVYYTLHIRHVPELELYGALAESSANLKYDKIQAAWAAWR